jgi:hypothetical protein
MGATSRVRSWSPAATAASSAPPARPAPGLHGHHREPPCWHVVQLAGDEGAYARPNTDCGYWQEPDRRCLGSDLSSGAGAINAIAADLLWETRQRAKQRANQPDEPDD